MARRRPHHRPRRNSAAKRPRSGVRIIGGKFRGRWIEFPPDLRTRPMKDRTREAIFNLVGKVDEQVLVVDLFAGTGAMALEALSRGAGEAVCVELHQPTARRIAAAAHQLGLDDRLDVEAVDVFAWWRRQQTNSRLSPQRPWWVFCCPPYALLKSHREAIDQVVAEIWQQAPAESWFVLEADGSFEGGRLPEADWDVRRYPPAVVYLALKSGEG